jgi:hypothetical protein
MMVVNTGGNMLVPISDAQAEELETYSGVSGVSVEELIAEAVGEYLECVISSRSEALGDGAAEA